MRFERAGGVCQKCGRPHGARVRCLPDGRWFDPAQNAWRDRRGRLARWPDLEEVITMRTTLVVLAAAHLNHDPTYNRWRNLRSLCQRCHILHDWSYHLAQRWITYRLRYAIGDLFLGLYQCKLAASVFNSSCDAALRGRQAEISSATSEIAAGSEGYRPG